MALDTNLIDYQIKRISNQVAAVKSFSTKLNSHKSNLNNSWSGTEAVYFNQVIDNIANNCRILETSMQRLSKDINSATEKIISEEAAITFSDADGEEC